MEDVRRIRKNSLLKGVHSRRLADLKTTISDLGSSPEDPALSLYAYLASLPERFFSRPSYHVYRDYLFNRHKADHTSLSTYLRDEQFRISQAFLFLSEINREDWHDRQIDFNDYSAIRFLDQTIHRTYLRLVEGVFFPLTRLIAYFQRRDRGKNTDGLDVFNVVEELRASGMENLCREYSHTIRNGIGHGGITFLQDEIVYRDKKGNQEVESFRGIIARVDGLFDTCNGLALALKVFLWLHRNQYAVPRQFLLEELQAETEAPWWRVLGTLPSRVGEKKQLNVFALASTRDYEKARYSTFQTEVLAEFLAPGYDRYFVGIRSSRALPGWGAFDGKRLRAIRARSPSSILDYTGAVEDDLIFYVPHFRLPRFLAVIDTLLKSIRLQWRIARRDQLARAGIPDIQVRYTSLHRNGVWAVLKEGVVVSLPSKEFDRESIRRWRRRILAAVRRMARKEVSELSPLKRLPVGYCRVTVFQADHRARTLESYGLGPDLVCTIQTKRIKRIKAPDIFGAEIEVVGSHRIAWNRNWIESFEAEAKQDRT